MLRATRRGYVGGGAPITEETSLLIKIGFAAYGNVEHRTVPAGGPVPEVVKWLVRLEGRDVTAPLLRLLLEVGGEIPSRRADPERGVDANSGELLGSPDETAVRPGVPEPIGSRVGVGATALLALSERGRGTLVLRDFVRHC